MPCHHRALQRAVIGLLATAIVQRRGLLGVDVDFIVVADQRPASSPASRFTAGAAGFLTLIQWSVRPERYGEPSCFDNTFAAERTRAFVLIPGAARLPRSARVMTPGRR